MANRQKNRQAWVSASKAGRAEFCPHYLELENKRTGVSKKAIAARKRGDAKHDSFNRKAEDKRCYIASYMYGIDDERTQMIRDYRDARLSQSLSGQLFVKVYYRLSPYLVDMAKRVPALERQIKRVVDIIVKRLKEDSLNG